MKKNGNSVVLPGQGGTYCTRLELARILHVSVRKVDAMIAQREIPVLHLGKLVRFRLEDVERRLKESMLTDSENPNPPSA